MFKLLQISRRSPACSPLLVISQVFSGIEAGLWLGHSKTLTFLFWLFSWLGCVLWVVIMFKGEILHLQFSVPELEKAWYLELVIPLPVSTRAPEPAEEPQSMMLPPSCFTVGVVVFVWWAVLFWHQTYCIFWKFRGVWMFFFCEKWLPSWPPHSQTCAEYGRLLSHTQVIHFLLVLSLTLEGHPELGNVPMVPQYHTYWLMKLFTVFHGRWYSLISVSWWVSFNKMSLYMFFSAPCSGMLLSLVIG